MVFEAVCKTLLWWPSGANVVRFIDTKIRKRLVISFLRIILGDPVGIITPTDYQRFMKKCATLWNL